MPTSHLATVHAIYDAFARGDLAAILSHLADDVVWDADGASWGLPWYEPRCGIAAVPGFFTDLAENTALHRFEPLNFLEGGNQVAVVIDLELEVRRTGRRVHDLEVHLWTFDEAGKVARFAHVLDRHGQVAAWRGVAP